VIAKEKGAPLALTAEVFYAVAAHFQVTRIESLARSLPVADYYDGLVLERALEMLAEAHRRIAAEAIAVGGRKPLDSWIAARHEAVERTVAKVTAMIEGDALTVSRVTVAAGVLADLVR
jgi:glutamate dehydrogenase